MWSCGSVIGSSTRSLVEERQPGAAAAGLRLVRVGVGIGRVVVEPEPRHAVPRRGGWPATGSRPRPSASRERASPAAAPQQRPATRGRGRRGGARGRRPRSPSARRSVDQRRRRRRSARARGSRRSGRPSASSTSRSTLIVSQPGAVSTSWVSTSAQLWPSGQGARYGTGSPATLGDAREQEVVEVVQRRLDRPAREPRRACTRLNDRRSAIWSGAAAAGGAR